VHPLVALGQLLREQKYEFTTITPESHARVNARSGNERAKSLRDVFGWSRPFDFDVLPKKMIDLLEQANALENRGPRTEDRGPESKARGPRPEGRGLLRSRVRYSTDENHLFVHSAFPTTDASSVFFGPDTYRYLRLLRERKPRATRAVDVGCGSGAGGIAIAKDCECVVLADINDLALEYARVNVALNGVTNAEIVKSDVLRDVERAFDLVISNPPYLIDEQARLYRDGGGKFGEGLSVEIVRQAAERLSSDGRILIYTASGIVEGVDTFFSAVKPLLGPRSSVLGYDEIDPDVFGEELARPTYASVDRIAVVALDAIVR
jgi:SAM-dependent methyltransferase